MSLSELHVIKAVVLEVQQGNKVCGIVRNACHQSDCSAGPAVERVEEGVEWLLQQRAAGRPVYVHCAHGHGRSTVVLCAALVASGHADTFQEAFDDVKALRPRVKRNYRQRRTLVEWAERRSKLAKSQ